MSNGQLSIVNFIYPFLTIQCVACSINIKYTYIPYTCTDIEKGLEKFKKVSDRQWIVFEEEFYVSF